MASRYISSKRYWAACAFTVAITLPLGKKALYPSYDISHDASDKTVILTGATGTLGTATAVHLARSKCRLIMACRNMERCKTLRRELVLLTGNNSISCRRLNLENTDSINNFADDIIKNESRIDALVNVAGVKDLPNKELTTYGIEKHFWVNFLAPYLLTSRLIEKLRETARKTKDVRIVNIVGAPKPKWPLDPSDINFDQRPYSGRDAYRQSKLALTYFTILLDHFYRSEHIHVFGISPPDIDRLSPILDYEDDNFWGNLRLLGKFFSNWWTISANSACGSIVFCSINPRLSKDSKAGARYKYIMQSFGKNNGWGVLKERDLDAKVVWNLGAQILLALPKGTTSHYDKNIVDRFNNEGYIMNPTQVQQR